MVSLWHTIQIALFIKQRLDDETIYLAVPNNSSAPLRVRDLAKSRAPLFYLLGPFQMVKCRPAGMRTCSLGLVGLGFRVRDKVRVSVRDRVGVRDSDGVRVSTFYFLSH